MNPALLKFIIKNNLEESKPIEPKEKKEKKTDSKMVAYSKFAVVPVEIRNE